MIDVVISGAGPAGSMAATTLARAGVRVLLLDREPFPRHKLCGDTLNPGGLAVLRGAGLGQAIETRGLPLDGMLVTGGSGVCIRGTYGDGFVGRAWARRLLDAELVSAATSAGADFDPGVRVVGPVLDAQGRVAGVRVRTRGGAEHDVRARWTIAADGRRSPLGLALGLVSHPPRPRRWAIGTYADGVEGLGRHGEMHVRSGHYIGVAPADGGTANLCLVSASRDHMHDPAARLWQVVREDPVLRDRVSRARQIAPVVTLGPLAVDARAAGVPGLLLAGDAAGFVDPMTGDGLHLALRGGQLAGRLLLDHWSGTDEAILDGLRSARQVAFAGKLRFNRVLRALVGSPMGVRCGAWGASIAPGVLRRVIAMAGDVTWSQTDAAA